jgi:hypothetical protein
MGGGSGGLFSKRTPEQLVRAVRKLEDETGFKDFEVRLSAMLNDLLASYNGRDIDLVKQRLDSAMSALGGAIDGSLDQLFGGSVAKHTYVDGLSDIDSLVLINGSGLEAKTPQDILNKIATILDQKLNGVVKLQQGRMAITMQFSDGMIIQILPAIRTDEGTLKVPSSRTTGWSHIDPAKFREALTKTNQDCAGKLVPTIKLAKAIIGELPESQRLSGYHVESLAIAAFRDYAGEKTTPAMLPAFFERARDLVDQPIRDSTGQSVHVDAYLGPAGSDNRIAASHVLGRIAKRMRNASVAGSEAQWRSIFGFDT